MKEKETCIIHFGPGLREKGGVVSVINGIVDSKLSFKYNLRNIETTKSKGKMLSFLKSIINFIRMKRIYDIKIVHIHMASYGSFYRKSIMAILASMFKIPIVIHVHGACFNIFYNSLNKCLKKYCNYIFKLSNKVIVLSESWKEFFISFVNEEKILVLHNSVKISENFNKEIKTDNEKVTFLFMGRCSNRKGVYDLLDIVENIKNDNEYTENNFELLLAGDGELEKIKNIINVKKIDNIVKVLGWVDEKEREELLKKSDVFILPSYNEGLPMAMLEAMSRGLVPVVSSVGGIPEVIKDGLNGYINEAGDKEAFYTNMVNLICHKDLIFKIGKNAFDTVYNDFNSEKEMMILDKLYKEILDQN